MKAGELQGLSLQGLAALRVCLGDCFPVVKVARIRVILGACTISLEILSCYFSLLPKC